MPPQQEKKRREGVPKRKGEKKGKKIRVRKRVLTCVVHDLLTKTLPKGGGRRSLNISRGKKREKKEGGLFQSLKEEERES